MRIICLAFCCFLGGIGICLAHSSTPQQVFCTVDSMPSAWRVIWRTDFSTPIVRIAWTMPTQGIPPEVLFLLVHYTRLHRPKDSLPIQINYRTDLPGRVIWEGTTHVKYADRLIQTLFRDVMTLELTERRLSLTLMQLERLLNEPRSASDWFYQQEVMPVIWGHDLQEMLPIPTYRKLRQVQIEQLQEARLRLAQDTALMYVGCGPIDADSILLLVNRYWHPATCTEFPGFLQHQNPIPDVWPCDTSWVSLQEDANSPLVIHAWIWPYDSLGGKDLQALEWASTWLESNQSSLYREWVSSQRIYQVRTQVIRGRSRIAFLSYAFPRIDQVEEVRDLFPEAIRQTLRDDAERMQTVDSSAFNRGLEHPDDWMRHQFKMIRYPFLNLFPLEQMGFAASSLLNQSPCVRAILANSKHARQAGLEPDENGMYLEPAEPEPPIQPADEDRILANPEADTLHTVAFPSDLLADAVIYFDSRYPEIRDEKILAIEQVLDVMRQYPEARLVIYGSVVNRREINSDLIGIMWAEYIRDFLVQKRQMSSSRIIPKAGLLLDQPHISRRWDRRISFQLVVD